MARLSSGTQGHEAWASPSPLPLQFFVLYLLGGMFARPSETLLHLTLFSAFPSL